VRLASTTAESSVWPTTVARAAPALAAAEPRHGIATESGHQSLAREWAGCCASSNDSPIRSAGPLTFEHDAKTKFELVHTRPVGKITAQREIREPRCDHCPGSRCWEIAGAQSDSG